MENHDNTTENFAELLNSEEATQNMIQPNRKVRGKVISSDEEKITVNLNYKADGILPKSEYTKPDMYLDYPEGKEIEVFVDKKNDGSGQVLLKMRKSQSSPRQFKVSEIFLNEDSWKGRTFDAVVDRIVKKPAKAKDGETAEAVTAEAAKEVFAGFSVTVDGTRVFVPAGRKSLRRYDDLSVYDKYVGQTIQVTIESVTKNDREGYPYSIIASAKDYFDKLAEAAREERRLQNEAKKAEVISELTVNQTIHGKVRSIKYNDANEFSGVFVEIKDNVLGFIPASQFDWDRTKDPKSVIKEKDEIDAVVLQLDADKKHITLSRKQMMKSPFDDIETKYPVDMLFECRVASIGDRIAIVELEPMIKGIITIGEIALKHVDKIEDEIKVGEIIRAVVISNEEVPYTDRNGRERTRPKICLSRRKALLADNPELQQEYEKAREERRRERNNDTDRPRRHRQPGEDNAHMGEHKEQNKPERKSRRDEFSYTLPEEERSTTSLASLFSALKTDDEN